MDESDDRDPPRLVSRSLHVDVEQPGPGLPSPPTETDVVVDLRGRHAATPDILVADWWADARCNDGSGGLARLFFSEKLQDIARAQAICATCTALVPCLEGAIERREPRGVWGGQLFADGRIVAAKRRRGRPRKVPTPDDQLPERPLPEHLRGVAVVRRRASPSARTPSSNGQLAHSAASRSQSRTSSSISSGSCSSR